MPQDARTDEELVELLGSGDTAALAELVGRHQSKVLSLAYRMLGDWDQAEDVGQEVFLRIFRSARRYEGKSKFTTWMYRIVVNLCLDQRRRRRPISPLEDAGGTAQVPERPNPLEQREIAEAVRVAVDELSERQRTVIILHRFQDCSHEQISEMTGWSKSAVESLLVRAYRALRVKLQKIQDMEQ